MNPKPIKLKFRLFKNPKGFEIMGKGGKDSNPIPPRNAGNIAAETDKAEAAKGTPCAYASRPELEWRLSYV